MRKRLLMFAAAGLLSACVTIGKPFPVEQVPSIELNVTHKTQLLELFREPHRTGIDDGDETWTYVHYRLRLLGGQDTRDLYVRFNKDGTVKSYSFNSSLEEDRESLDALREKEK